MQNFNFYNPVHVIFGKNTIAQLKDVIDRNQKVMMIYGGGSIKKNGIYEDVMKALSGYDVVEFGGIEANPDYDTCMKAVQKGVDEKVDFLLSVGGGSVLDATKLIAAAIPYEGENAWDDIVLMNSSIEKVLPIGCVLTLPATGSEMNGNSVISWRAQNEKRAFSSKLVMPKFSILDPETTYSLSQRQTANGIVDAFVHVMEQYMTYPVNAPLQDRQAEAILQTLIEEGPKAFEDPQNYDVRANVMWSATNALNQLISCGVPQDWSTHQIGHELTALFGLDHAQTLAIVLPALLRFQKENKFEKLLQYGQRIWNLSGTDEEIVQQAIVETEEFFEAVHVPTRLKAYDIALEDALAIVFKLEKRNVKLGERGNITHKEVDAILRLAAE